MGLDIIKGLELIEFQYRRKRPLPNGAEPFTHPIGFNADNCEEVFPYMVTREHSDGSGIKFTSRTHLIPVLVKAVQELLVRVEAIEEGAEQLP